MMVASSKVDPQQLPPTEHAAHYHSFSVHLRVVKWTVPSNDMRQAKEWGWKMGNNSLCPVMTDLDAEPAKVQQFIPCTCQSSGTNPCATKQRSCQKNGLKRLIPSNECHGQSCNNTDMTIDDLNVTFAILEVLRHSKVLTSLTNSSETFLFMTSLMSLSRSFS